MNSESEIQLFLGKLAKAFPSAGKLSKELGEEYVDEIKGPLAFTDLEKLKSKLKRENEFFPSIKKILDAAKEIYAQEKASKAREWNGGPAPLTAEHIGSADRFMEKLGIEKLSDLLKRSKP